MATIAFFLTVYVAYAVMKLVGYSLSAYAIRAVLVRPDVSPWRVGLVRTLLGIVVGGLYTAGWAVFGGRDALEGVVLTDPQSTAIWYAVGLVPVRILEWTWLIWYFFDRRFDRPGRDVLCVVLGVVWSFVLDLPALLGVISILSSIC